MLRGIKPAFPALWALILAESFAASLFYRNIQDVLLAAVVVGLLAFGYAVAVAPGFSSGWRLPRSASVLFLLAFWIYLAASPLWSTVPCLSMVFVYIISALPLIFFSVVLAPDREQVARLCMQATGVVLLGVALWAVTQFVFLQDIYGHRIHHPLLYANNLGALMSMPAAFTLAFFLYAPDKKRAAVFLGLFALFFMALLVTQSRGGILCFAVVTLIMLATGYKDMGSLSKKLLAVVVLTGLLYVGVDFSLGRGMSLSDAFGRMENSATDTGIFGRLELWRAVWRMAHDHFWTGTGLGTFFYYYPPYRVPRESSDGYFAHMDPLQFWSDMGILAPVLFYSMLAAILVRTGRALRAASANREIRARVAASFCALLGLALHAHIDFQLYVLPILFPAGALLAFWYVATCQALGEDTIDLSSPKLRPALPAAATFGFFLALVWILRLSAGIWLVNSASAQLSGVNPVPAEKLLDYADFWAPESYSQVSEYQGRLAYARLEAGGDALSSDQKTLLYNEALDRFAEARKWSPANPYVFNFEALLRYKAYKEGIAPDGEERAIELLRQALAFDPLFIHARMGLADIFTARGEKGRALNEALLPGIGLPRPISWLSVTYLMQTALLIKEVNGDGTGYNSVFYEAKNLAESLVEQENKRK